MKYLFFLIPLLLKAFFINDDYHKFAGIKAYKNKNYKSAINHFQKIDIKDDFINYDLANAYYKLGDYKNAIIYYKKVYHKDLLHKKYHNLGNAYAKSNQIQKSTKN